MGKDLRGKEIGEGIYQQPNGTYCARFVDKFGKRKSKRSKKLQEVRQWIADATYIDEHSDIEQATNMLVDAWFDYWIDIKKKTVRAPLTTSAMGYASQTLWIFPVRLIR